MTDTTTAAEAARVAAENEASREIIAQAAPDNPNPDDGNQNSEVGSQRPDPTSDLRVASSEAKPLERITAADRSRAEIAARFKEKRAAHGGQVEFHGDMRDPSQTYGPLGLAPEQISDVGDQRSEERPPAQQQATTEAPPAEPASPTSDLRPPTSEAQPKLVKVKVHGREAWLPENEVIAEAQKSLAAGNLLESAKEVLAGARGRMSDVGGQMSDVHDPSSDLRPLTSAVRHPTSDIRPLRRTGTDASTGERRRRRHEAQTDDRERDLEGAPRGRARGRAPGPPGERACRKPARAPGVRKGASGAGRRRVRARFDHHPGAARDQRRPAGGRFAGYPEGTAEEPGRA